MNLKYNNWAMLATDIEKVRDGIRYPVLFQEKLNGIRAKWDVEKGILISRQGEPWLESILPHIYKKLKDFRGVSFDGELYAPGLKLQQVLERCAVTRIAPHEDCGVVNYYIFDTITALHTENRQNVTKSFAQALGFPYVESFGLLNHTAVNGYYNSALKNGAEGAILRQTGHPYIVGRTEALIKIKPWRTMEVTILKVIEGLGKLQGTFGTFLVCETMNEANRFFVGGGQGMTNGKRAFYWECRSELPGEVITIRYRDISSAGTPLQPQIVL